MSDLNVEWGDTESWGGSGLEINNMYDVYTDVYTVYIPCTHGLWNSYPVCTSST